MDFVTVGSDRASAVDDDGFRDIKVAKTDPTKAQRSNLSEPHHQPFSHPHLCSPTGFTRNSGSVQGVVGPFTPSQWMELEHQALIYKYITAYVPIPSYLLNPIRKAFQSAAYSRFNTLGWGGFRLGSYCNGDPEPGRCRRTDGKKWRCSRDALPDQKYCDRHMNRGRHRSRKPVEGQSANPNSPKLPDFAAVNPLTSFNDRKDRSLQHPLRQFINDDCPNIRHTELSISMSDFYSPKLTAAASSPRGLEMGLAVGTTAAQRQSGNWVPISWELPMGGPLGEALHSPAEFNKTAKPLNLIDGWDSGGGAECSNSRCTGTIGPGALVNPSLPAL